MLCVKCRQPLTQNDIEMRCAQGHTFHQVDGIWRMLQDHTYDTFLGEYETIRKAEGRGSTDPAHYRSLPWPSPEHPQADAWAIRAQSYETLIRHLIPEQSMHILDLGAGSGWLSHRLIDQGHQAIAVDLSTSEVDGLGALKHYPTSIDAYQSTFETLPFDDNFADIAIFNASFHYTNDALQTLKEAFRVTRDYVVVMDTPVYDKASTGEEMVAERHAAFEATYGFRSDSRPMINYLTWSHIEQLAHDLAVPYHIAWTRSTLHRMLRRLKISMMPGRPPAEFPLIRFG